MILLLFMHAGAPPHFLLALPEFLNKVFLEQGKGPGGPKQCLFLPWFKSLRVLLLGSSGISCLCYRRRMTSATSNKEYRMDVWIFVRHAEISSDSSSHCSHLQSHTSNTFFNRQEALNRKPCFRRSTFIEYSVLVLRCRITLCWFGRVFFVHSLQAYISSSCLKPPYLCDQCWPPWMLFSSWKFWIMCIIKLRNFCGRNKVYGVHQRRDIIDTYKTSGSANFELYDQVYSITDYIRGLEL